MASSSANWSLIKDQKQHQSALSKGLLTLSAPDNPFKIDVSFFHQHAQFPHQHATPFEAGVDGKDERELKGYKQYLPPYVPNKEGTVTKESVLFCTKHHCTYAKVEAGLNTLEQGFLMQACSATKYHYTHSAAECDAMMKYLRENPIDGDEIPTTDSNCYETKKAIVKRKNKKGEMIRVVKNVPCETRFYKDYKTLRNDAYKYLRASIPLYLGSIPNSVLKAHIAELERNKDPPLTDLDKLDEKRRVKYSEIKDFILNHILFQILTMCLKEGWGRYTRMVR
jgi:hypothetical protein